MKWTPGTPVRLGTRRFIIRSMTQKDVTPEFVRWSRDPDVVAGFNRHQPPQDRAQYMRLVEQVDHRGKFFLLITASFAETPIGFFVVTADLNDKTAETTVVIGRRDWWGKGVVPEARARLMDFLFDDVAMEKVWGRPHARNMASIFNYKTMGFRCEAVLRNHLRNASGPGRLDQYFFAMSRDEWVEKRLKYAGAQ